MALLQALLSTTPSNSDSLHHRINHRAAAECNIPHQTPNSKCYYHGISAPSCVETLDTKAFMLSATVSKSYFCSSSFVEGRDSFLASCSIWSRASGAISSQLSSERTQDRSGTLHKPAGPQGPNQLTDRTATTLQLSFAVKFLCWSCVTHGIRQTEAEKNRVEISFHYI